MAAHPPAARASVDPGARLISDLYCWADKYGLSAPQCEPVLRKLMETYRDALQGFFSRSGFAAQEVEDAVQEVWFRILRTTRPSCKSRFDPSRGKPFQAWLLGIAKRVWADLVKGRSPSPTGSHQAPGSQAGVTPLGLWRPSVDDVDALVWAFYQQLSEPEAGAFQKLNRSEQQVFVLAVYVEMSAGQIAEKLGLKTGTVYNKFSAARKKLEELLS